MIRGLIVISDEDGAEDDNVDDVTFGNTAFLMDGNWDEYNDHDDVDDGPDVVTRAFLFLMSGGDCDGAVVNRGRVISVMNED